MKQKIHKRTVKPQQNKKTYPKFYKKTSISLVTALCLVSLYFLIPFAIVGLYSFNKGFVSPVIDFVTQKPKIIAVNNDGKVEINNNIIPKAEVVLKKWGDEAQLKIGVSDLGGAKKIDKSGATQWEGQEKDVNFYKVNNTSSSNAGSWDKDTMRSLNLGAISPSEAASLGDYWHQNTPSPMIVTYRMDRNAYVFWGYRDASTDLKDLNNLTAPIYRFQTAQRKTCPVILATPQTLVNYVYLPSLDKHPEYLDLVQASIIETLKKQYGVDIFKVQSGLMYRDGLKVKQLGRIDQEGDYVGYYLYLDSPLNTNLVDNMNLETKTRDTVLFPIGGLREINPSIGLSVTDLLNQNIAKKFNTRLVDGKMTVSEKKGIDGFNTIQEDPKWKTSAKRIDDDFTKFDDNSQKFELDVTLKKKPKSNTINFDIDTKNLDFLYQPDLTQEEKARGDIRPENVVGSYAVYNKDKKDNYEALGGKNYASGKAFHIYRPMIIDASGRKVWGELHVDTEKNLLTVTVPQDFLDQAVYPVVVDPTFGYTSVGASSITLQSYDRGSVFTGSYGVGTSMSYYLIPSKTQTNYQTRGALYQHSNSGLVSNGATNVAQSPQNSAWVTAAFPTAPNLSPQDYVLMVSSAAAYSTWPSIAYDGGAANQGHTQTGTAAGTPPNPGSFAHDNNKYSVYVTYTPDTTKPTNPTTLTSTPSSWSNTNSFTFNWSGATDSGGAGIKGYEYKRQGDASWTFTAGTSVSGITSLVDGTNVFMVRTIDNANNTADNYTSVNYYYDAYAPPNPGSVTAKSQSGGVTLSDNTWYNYSSPYFSWTPPTDCSELLCIQNAAGVSGYYVYFGTDPNANPSSYQTLTNYTASSLVTGSTYYFRIKTKDNAGNISSTTTLFTYKYDSVKPTNPFVERNPVGWSSTNSFSFSFSGAVDTGGSGIKGYEYKRQSDAGWTFTDQTLVSGIQVYQNGTNVFMVRTVDNAGNTADNYTSVNYYYSGNAPSPPQNLSVSPQNNTQNSFDFTWQIPATYDGGIKGYRWSVNAVPSDSNTVYTTQTTTGAISAATQQSLNTFYVVAIDSTDKVNYANYASTQFEVHTTAPNPPLAPVISDISNRNSSPPKWALALSWNAPVSGGTVDHYIIQRSLDQSSWTQVGTVTSRAFAGSGLDSTKTYYYRIIAVDNAGAQSAVSAVVSKQPTGKFATPPDIRPPQIRVTVTSATITWSTDRASSSFIKYGKTLAYGASSGSPDSAATHTVTLSGLEPGTAYHYRQQSYDEDRDYSPDSAVSGDYTFTTLPPPGISDVKVSDITLYTATLTWKTTSSATSNFQYGKTNTYGKEYSDPSGSSTTNHTAKLAGLDHSSTYHFKIFGTDTDGNNMQSDDYSFNTLIMPKITNLKIEQVKGNRAMLKATWDSNVPTTSSVEYTGGSDSKTMEITQSDLVSKHEVVVTQLKDDTEYSLTVIGRDAYGNEGNAENRKVKTALDTTPPEISEITTETAISGYGKNAKTQMVVSWYTDEPSTSQVEYNQGVSGNSYAMKTKEDGALVTSHVIVVTGLDPSSSYYFRVVSRDKSDNEAKSEANSALTDQTRSSIFDIVLKSFEDTLGWLFGMGQ